MQAGGRGLAHPCAWAQQAELRLQWGKPTGPGFLIEPDHQAWEHSHAQAVPVDKHTGTSEWASQVAQW